MKRSQAFPSTYLSKDDLPEPPGAKRVTIADVRMEPIESDGQERDKAVMYFDGKVKPFILNNTNWMTIEDVYGDETEGWSGKDLDIYLDPGVMYQSKRVGGVRVRVPANGVTAQADTWTAQQALTACESAGLTRLNIRECLTQNGRKGWDAARDTPLIQDLIKRSGVSIVTRALDEEEDEILF